VSEKFFVENQILRVPYPPYSPDLAPSDFWLFGHMKAGLVGQSFAEPERFFEGIMYFLEEVQVSELKLIFHHLVERIRWVLDHNGITMGTTIMSKSFDRKDNFQLLSDGPMSTPY
jgi:hypothetical protein